MEKKYNRERAVRYARQWALGNNPDYYNFAGIGGDCASFASQCLYSGSGVMNYDPVYGWYYISVDNRAPAWSGVEYLRRFLLGNKKAGPYADEVQLGQIKPGDILQIATVEEHLHHTLVVVQTGEIPSFENTLVCAHSYASLDRPLATYDIKRLLCMQINGVRT